jgi:transposase-like protein
MVEQLTGKDPASARSLARDTGISQETLSRWLREARSLPVMPPRRHESKTWSIDERVRRLWSGASVHHVADTRLAHRARLRAQIERRRRTLRTTFS